MPLVTITAADWWYPREPQPMNGSQLLTYSLGKRLPSLFATHAQELGLGPEIPEDGVQVNFECFHGLAINAPDLWILCQLTETLRDKAQRQACEARLADLIEEWLSYQPSTNRPRSLAIDLFFGPGHGRLRRSGLPTIRW